MASEKMDFILKFFYRKILTKKKKKTDVDPERDDDASPMSTYRWDLLEWWFQLFSTSQNTYKSYSISNFLEKNKILVPMLKYSWRPLRWCINYLCRTGIDKARAISFLGVRKLGVRTEFNFVDFELFEKKKSHFWVSMVYYSWRPFYWCINY